MDTLSSSFCKSMRLEYLQARIIIFVAQSTFDECITADGCDTAEQALELFRSKVISIIIIIIFPSFNCLHIIVFVHAYIIFLIV